MTDTLAIEVAYALPNHQVVVALSLESGASAADAVRASGLAERFPEVLSDGVTLGIYARTLADPSSYTLQDGDRVEIYRPLLIDPKEARRQRAAKARQRPETS